MIYLDHAATTPVPKAVAEEMVRVLTEEYGNPSSQYAYGRRAKSLVEDCRGTVAQALGCEAARLFFTSCGTESDNWAFTAALWQNRRVGRHIVTTAVEHSAVLERCRWLEQDGYEITRILPDRDGNIPAEKVLEAVRADTALVSVMLVNNETGNVYPISEIAAGLRIKNEKALLHTDAVQGFLKIPFSAKTLGADFIALSAHKIGGPKGIGALYIGGRVRGPRALLPGGGQESGFRAGTEATAQIAGFAKAAELRLENFEDKLRHMANIKAYAVERLGEIPDLRFIAKGTAPHVLSVSMPGYPSQNVVNELSEAGICISAGSACHQGKPSQVTAALGLEKRVAAGVVRLSFGPETTKEEIDAAADALRRHHDARFPML
ncbi:cysteine desulfurase family protein [Oscillibacter sp.]|uniref:cysteine desulfurase family protein n=1 Tax=Oscillibacter sp. TaxID=1945593 RepID=UPI00289F1DC0|nr:cysteine desulfurase family protein [Oscillibacter sp.]